MFDLQVENYILVRESLGGSVGKVIKPSCP